MSAFDPLLSRIEGQVVVLCGPNGAGKTRMVRRIADHVRAQGGNCLVINDNSAGFKRWTPGMLADRLDECLQSAQAGLTAVVVDNPMLMHGPFGTEPWATLSSFAEQNRVPVLITSQFIDLGCHGEPVVQLPCHDDVLPYVDAVWRVWFAGVPFSVGHCLNGI